MKILLLHPEDDPEKGPWSGLPWERVIDLGMAGMSSYKRWEQHFGCPVTMLNSFREGFDTLRQVRGVLGRGCNRLVDRHGLDWWEIMSILLTDEVEALILLQKLAQTVGGGDEVHVTRPGLHADLLQALLPGQVKVFNAQRKRGLGHYLRVSKKLSAWQMVDVFWDKYDAGYQFRGRMIRPRSPSKQPVVLVPTAYVNVSRTGITYANTFRSENFLLVTTRRSGFVQPTPANVTNAWLSSYAVVRDRSAENAEVQNQWESLLKDMDGVQEFKILQRLGYLENFPLRFRRGLEVRDAWCNVLDIEPVQGVLCADDSNPYTRIPLLLAQGRGLPNIACHHGALDGRYVYKRALADHVWVKGRMEQDYLVRKCGVPGKKVEIAAPAMPVGWAERDRSESGVRPHILFISEASDVSGGRPEEFYRDILPRLANLARETGRRLIVKLHPAESKTERARWVARILSPEQKAVTSIVSGPLEEKLLEKTWFGITILSTVAIDCALRGIPCFLCKWLEFWPYGYIEQFLRFGIGLGLEGPEQIANIPEYLEQFHAGAGVKESCWQAADSDRLRQLLASSEKTAVTAQG